MPNQKALNVHFSRILLILLGVIATACCVYLSTNGATPLHGFAVFGNDGSTDQGTSSAALPSLTKAHFIVIGRDVYFDRNEDGVAGSDEKFQHTGNQFDVPLPGKPSRYRLTSAVIGMNPDSVSESLPQHIILNVNVHSPGQPDKIEFQQAAKVTVHAHPCNQGWAHFDGPLAFQFSDDSTTLAASGGPSVDLRVTMTTPPDAGRNPTTTVPGTLVPTATVEFPSGSPNQPIAKRYDMDQFC